MALLSPEFLDCVAAVGFPKPDGTTHWSATGFFYGHLLRQSDVKKYRVFLVTNRHVLQGHQRATIRLNPKADAAARCFDLLLDPTGSDPTWLPHPDPNVDVAAARVDVNALLKNGIQLGWFENDLHALAREQAHRLGVSEGDGVFVLGFPLGVVGNRRNYVIARGGVLARVRDCLVGEASDFLVDASIFPGNSGGPVILKPEADAIRGTQANKNAYLLGIIASYLPYDDVAVSQQTGIPRIVFQENSGLAAAYPVDFITEVLRAFPAPQGFELA